jgi:hypothetical protein
VIGGSVIPQARDTVEIEIEGIGTLRTPIKALAERPGSPTRP